MSAIQDLIDGLAERIGMPIGIDDRRFRSIAYSSHVEEIDPVRRRSILGRQAPNEVTDWLLGLGVATSTGPVCVPANRTLEMVPRICFPLRFHERLLGYLWLAETSEPLSDVHVAQVSLVSGRLAEELFRLEQLERDTHRLEKAAVRALIGEPGNQLERIELADTTHRTVAAVVVTGADPGEVEVRLVGATARLRRALAPRHVLSLVDGTRATVALAGTPAELDLAAVRLLSSAEVELADLPRATVVVGLGTPCTRDNRLVTARRQAELAARVAQSAAPYGPLARYTEIEAYALIAELAAGSDPGAVLPAALQVLLSDADAHTLVVTAETYLEYGGDAAATARDLFIHRSSLYNRLRRVEELTGIDMRSGGDRLTLHLGLRLWRMSRTSTDDEAPAPKTRRSPSTAGDSEP